MNWSLFLSAIFSDSLKIVLSSGLRVSWYVHSILGIFVNSFFTDHSSNCISTHRSSKISFDRESLLSSIAIHKCTGVI